MNNNTKKLIWSMIPKWIAIAIILGLVIFNFTDGSQIKIIPERPELVPYMIVPIDPHPGDCNLEVGIRLVHPYNVENMQEPQQQETLEIIYQRIGFEIVNPEKSAGLFQIDGKLYHLIRIPYTGASDTYGYGWDWD